MKTTKRVHWAIGVTALNVAVALFLCGCASGVKYSFNQDFNDNLVTNPQYYIQNSKDNHFKVVVEQGVPSTGAERVLDLKTACSDIAKAESQRRGWDQWEVNYVHERDDGWMHVVVADVVRK